MASIEKPTIPGNIWVGSLPISSYVTADTLAEMRIGSEDNWAGDTSLQSLFLSPSTLPWQGGWN